MLINNEITKHYPLPCYEIHSSITYNASETCNKSYNAFTQFIGYGIFSQHM